MYLCLWCDVGMKFSDFVLIMENRLPVPVTRSSLLAPLSRGLFRSPQPPSTPRSAFLCLNHCLNSYGFKAILTSGQASCRVLCSSEPPKPLLALGSLCNILKKTIKSLKVPSRVYLNFTKFINYFEK